MSGSGTKSSARSNTKRLIQELQDYHKDPNPALLHLGPVSDDELTKWTAVLKGVEGTAYEGMPSTLLFGEKPNGSTPSLLPTLSYHSSLDKLANSSLSRRPMATHNPNPTFLPLSTPNNNLHHPHLPPKHPLQNRRNLPRPPQDLLVARLYHL
jgi:hypothetical protein